MSVQSSTARTLVPAVSTPLNASPSRLVIRPTGMDMFAAYWLLCSSSPTSIVTSGSLTESTTMRASAPADWA